MQGRASVSVLGSINMDLVAHADRIPRPGETVLGSAFSTAPGGKGSNQAIAAARAGADVTFIGAVGDDQFAPALVSTLEAAGVSTARLRRVPGASGIAVISVDAAAENNIIVIPGANATVTELTDDDATAISGSALLVTQLETPLTTVVAGARAAAAARVPVLLNPSPVRELPPELVDAVTILVVNEGEAEQLGTAVTDRVTHVVTTLGGRGARYRGPAGSTVTVPAPEVAAVDTTGAGDAFTGALAVAWAEGLPVRTALQWACAAGALATTTQGASASSPARRAIVDLVAATYGQSEPLPSDAAPAG